MPAESILSPNRLQHDNIVISKVTMWGLGVDERDKMWSVSAVAGPRDAMGAIAPSFKFDFVAFLHNFSAKFYIFVSSLSASDSISAFSGDCFRKT